MKEHTLRRPILIISIALSVLIVASPLASAVAAPAWLDRVNEHRMDAGLPSVLMDDSLNAGCVAHARYMVKNDYIGHSEDPSNPWYTAAGAASAARSNVLVSSISIVEPSVIDSWVVGPFHAIGILDPRLATVGFGSYFENVGSYHYGAALNVLDGRTSLPEGLAFPIMWPGDGSVVDVYEYRGSEHPDPLTHTGWPAPSGLPLIVQFGGGSANPVITASGFWEDGAAREHAVFTEFTYSNPDPSAQTLGRAILAGRDAVVLLPREPLSPGHVYSASLTVDGVTHAWSFSTPGASVDAVDYQEIAGADRCLTAIEASKAVFDDQSVDTVVIATSRNWPDALGGAALAGVLRGPVLLTGSTLSSDVLAEIDRLGATEAVVLGGTAAVSPSVEAALVERLGSDSVRRISGADRYETAHRVAEEVRSITGAGFEGIAFVASGANYPDALAASPLAAANGWPVFLTAPDAMASATLEEIGDLGIESAYVLGGSAAVGVRVEDALSDLLGGDNVRRLQGVDRYATAAAIAEFGSASGVLTWDHPAVATGVDFPDALTGGVMQAARGSVLLLNRPDSATASTGACLQAHADEIVDLTFLGGTSVIGDAVRDQLARLACP